MANFLNQDIILTGLPDGCVGHDIHFTGYRETNIMVLGTVPTIISAGDSDLVGVRIFQTTCLEKKGCNPSRRDDVARFSGDELR